MEFRGERKTRVRGCRFGIPGAGRFPIWQADSAGRKTIFAGGDRSTLSALRQMIPLRKRDYAKIGYWLAFELGN